MPRRPAGPSIEEEEVRLRRARFIRTVTLHTVYASVQSLPSTIALAVTAFVENRLPKRLTRITSEILRP